MSWSEEDGLWIARNAGLPGCSTHGETIEEALANLREAEAGWLATAGEKGWTSLGERAAEFLRRREARGRGFG